MTPHAYRLKEQIFGTKMATSENKFFVPKWLLLKISNSTTTVVKKSRNLVFTMSPTITVLNQVK